MNVPRMLINVVIVFLILMVFSYLGAITFPSLPSVNNNLATYLSNFLLLILPVIVMAAIAHFLGRGIRSIKNSFEALGLAYVSALIIGGILAILSLLNFAYSAHLNFTWLGTSWYAPWATMFLIGTPILLAFLV